MHETLHSNVPPSVMSFTQEPISNELSDWSFYQYGADSIFRHRELVREWAEKLLTKKGYKKLVEFKTTVELAEKRGGEWVLTLRKEVVGSAKDYWWQGTFDAVVVASGHFSVPFIPEIEGLLAYDERFPGRILHSKHYRGGEAFKNKVSHFLLLEKQHHLE
jgi:cation diffusion facilitator CzcD-associated flavoprotein CzcO